MKVFQKSCLWLHWMKTRPRIRRLAVFWILLQYSRRIQAKGGEVRHPPYSALIHPSNLRYFLRIHLSFLYGSAILVSYPQSFYATTIKICWHYKYQAQPNSSDPRIKSRIWRIDLFISVLDGPSGPFHTWPLNLLRKRSHLVIFLVDQLIFNCGKEKRLISRYCPIILSPRAR